MDTSIWTYGLALGLAVDAGLALALALSGRGLDVRNLGQYAWVAGWVAVLCWQGLPVSVAAFRAGVGIFVAWHEWHNPPPAAVSIPDASDEVEPSEPDYLPAWRAAAHRFVTAGNLYGFKVRDIAAGDHEVIGWDEWGLMRDFLIEAGVLSPRGGTHWNDGWSWPRWQREYMTLPLPPVTVAPPEVKLTVNSQRQQHQQHEKQPSEGVD